MSIIGETMQSEIVNDLGWTLLHSLWQGGVIYLAVILAIRWAASPNVRYLIGGTGMALLLTSSVITFVSHVFPATQLQQTTISFPGNFQVADAAARTNISVIGDVSTLIQSNLPLIVVCWFLGALFFSARLIGGWCYVNRLRTRAEFVSGEWEIMVNTLARKIGIRGVVSLAQSHQISGPVVLGYLKPVIMIPTGMLTGLSTAELEAIFIHELAHIKRHDYLVNLLQSLLEIIFFFNPFMWLMSAVMRKEREFACDDTVIAIHQDALVYARALAHLEESRISGMALGLSLAKNKNELLNRIKRIMEKSLTPTTGRDRIVVVTLMLAGLLCASWLTINTDDKLHNRSENPELAAGDTTIKNKPSRSQKMRKQAPAQEENHEIQVVPTVPDVDEIPSVDFVHPVPPVAPFDIEAEHADAAYYNQEKWERFNAQFEEKFQEKFKDFYEKHQKDIGKMMQELREEFRDDFSDERMAAIEASMAELERFELDHRTEISISPFHDEALMEMESAMHERETEMAKRHQENVHVAEQMELLSREMESQGRAARAQMEAVRQEMMVVEKSMKEFEKVLHEQLIKDGYFSKGQKIENVHWNDDSGEIRINGVEIKEKDRKKYRELHRKYFREIPEPIGTPE